MKNVALLCGVAALALAGSGGIARADVTAEQVWDDWRALFAGSGGTLSTTGESRSGNTLTVTGLTLTLEMPEGSSVATIDRIDFTEQGDGTVVIALSPDYRVTSSIAPEGEPPVTVAMKMGHEGLRLVASGDAAQRSYSYTADRLTLSMDQLLAAGEPQDAEVEAALNRVAGQTTISGTGDNREMNGTMTAASAGLGINAANPEAGGRVIADISAADLSMQTSGTATLGMAGDLAQMLDAGFRNESEISYGAIAYSFDFADATGSASGIGKAESGTLGVRVNPETIAYSSTGRGIEFSMSGTSIPLPEVAVRVEDAAFRFEMPLGKTDAPVDFGLLTSYRGLTVSDGIWNIFDPGMVLPRDPANVVIDVTGKARWLFDLMVDPGAAPPSGAAPGEIESLELNALEVSLAGASLTGSGGFTFDNNDLTTIPGMPRPEGAVDMKLVGGNGLLDKLVTLGFVPQEQAMGMRMMLGLFARPGDGEDTLVSKIEVTPTGQIVANGMPLR